MPEGGFSLDGWRRRRFEARPDLNPDHRAAAAIISKNRALAGYQSGPATTKMRRDAASMKRI